MSAGRRAPSARVPRPGTRAGSRSAVPSPRRSSRSSPRPPHRQREALLRRPGARAQQFDLHRQLPDVTLRRVEGPPPPARRDDPSSRVRGRPRPVPATPRAGRSPRPARGTPPPATHLAASAAQRRASGWRSSAAPAPGAPPRPPRQLFVRLLSGVGVHDLVKCSFRLGLEPLGQLVEHIPQLVKPVALRGCLRPNLPYRGPEAKVPIADRDQRSSHPLPLQGPEDHRPAVGAFAVAVLKRDELFRPVGTGPNHHQRGKPVVLETMLKWIPSTHTYT